MYKKCTVCNLTFEPEPGFYYGAMFISYAISMAMSVISGVVLFNDPDMWVYLVVIVILMLLVVLSLIQNIP
ncbi:MAG: hypothetical protein ACJA2S_001410 [Cyclobacteriaceae bacterium]|jgi:uncharacterized protein (DUF983 family)